MYVPHQRTPGLCEVSCTQAKNPWSKTIYVQLQGFSKPPAIAVKGLLE